MRPGIAATRFAKTRAPTPIRITVNAGTVGAGTTLILRANEIHNARPTSTPSGIPTRQPTNAATLDCHAIDVASCRWVNPIDLSKARSRRRRRTEVTRVKPSAATAPAARPDARTAGIVPIDLKFTISAGRSTGDDPSPEALRCGVLVHRGVDAFERVASDRRSNARSHANENCVRPRNRGALKVEQRGWKIARSHQGALSEPRVLTQGGHRHRADDPQHRRLRCPVVESDQIADAHVQRVERRGAKDNLIRRPKAVSSEHWRLHRCTRVFYQRRDPLAVDGGPRRHRRPTSAECRDPGRATW